MMFKRITAIVLALVLTFTSLPLTAAASEPQTSLDNENATVESSGTLGTLLSEEITQEQESEAEENPYTSGYALYELVVEGQTATVRFDTLETANLLVCIYDENSMKMITSANILVEESQTTAHLEFPQELPAYFYAEAFLLDNHDYSPLCASLDCPLYTREMQELLNSTVADYDAEQVLNLDSSDETNFLICADGTQLVDQVVGTNVVTSADEENRIYVIENADETFTGLAAGDTLVYPYNENGDVLIVKVAEITVDGTTVTITGDEVELRDIFSHVKISSEGDMENVELDEADLCEGIEYTGLTRDADEIAPFAENEGETSWEMGFKISTIVDKGTNAETSINGELKLSFDIAFDYYLTFSQQYVNLTTTVTSDFSVSFSGKVESKPIYLIGKNGFNIPLGTSGLAVNFAPFLTFSAGGAIKAEIDATIPMILTVQDGDISFSIGKIGSNMGQFETEFTVFAGIDLNPSVVVLDPKVAKLTLSAPFGFELKASSSAGEFDISYPAEKHTCVVCFSTKFLFTWSVAIKFKCFDSDLMSAELTLAKKEYPIWEGYLSIDKMEFGKGQCPYREFRVTFFTINSSNIYDPEAELTCDGEPIRTESFGNCAIRYFPSGTYLFNAYFPSDDMNVPQSVSVTGAKSVILTTSQEYLDRLQAAERFRLDPDSVVETDSYDYGDLSDTLTWVVYKSGKLQFNGTGYIPGFDSASDAPWYAYREKIKVIEVSEGVTAVGSYALSGLTNATELYLPDSLTNVSASAFENCTGLKKVRMPIDLNCGSYYSKSCKSAWTGCTGVEQIHYTLGQTGAMKNRNTLSSSRNDGYNNYTFALEYLSRNTLKNLYFEEGITSLGDYAFYGNTALENFTLPLSLTSIGSYAFYDNTIDEIQLPLTLQSLGSYAFYSCENLTQIELPQTLTRIPDYCFTYCTGLTEIVLHDGIGSLGLNAFVGCTGLTSVTLPAHLNWAAWASRTSNSSYTSCWSGCINVQQIHYTSGKGGVMADRNTNYTYSSSGQYNYNLTLEQVCRENLKTVILDNGITNVPDYAFYNCNALERIEIPATVTAIGNYAFIDCTGLTDLQIPLGVTKFGSSAFQNCVGLKSITFNEAVTSIPDRCFAGCTGLTEIVLHDGIGSLGLYAFMNCTGLTSVTLPAHLNWAAWASRTNNSSYEPCWKGCINVQQIHYTSGKGGVMADRNTNYTYSSSGQYNYNLTLEQVCRENLKTVILDNGITNVPDYAFYYCMELEHIEIPATVTAIGNFAFMNCTGLTDLQIPLSVTKFGSSAFQNCVGLKSITFNEAVTSIPDQCFYGCTGLTEIVLHDGIESLGLYAFMNCTGLTSVTLPAHLNWAAWASRTSNSSYEPCWKGCINVQQIHYTSGKDGVMADRNTNYTYSSSGHANYTLTLEQVCRENLKTVILDNGITNVPDYAFYYCMALEHIEIPATVTAIGNFAFMNCTGLTDLQIPLGVTKFGSHAFYNCVGLKSITFNEAVTSIPDQCFYGCTGLTEIVLHDGIGSLGLFAFAGCTGLTSVTLPAHLNWAAWVSRTSNSSYEPCWKGCINVQQIHYTSGKDGVMAERNTSYTYLSDGQYNYNLTLEQVCRENLKTVIIDEGITSVAAYAFYNCQALNHILFCGDLPGISGNSFSSVTATAYYPADNTTWEGISDGFGGTLTWVGYTLDESGNRILPDGSVLELPEPVPVQVTSLSVSIPEDSTLSQQEEPEFAAEIIEPIVDQTQEPDPGLMTEPTSPTPPASETASEAETEEPPIAVEPEFVLEPEIEEMPVAETAPDFSLSVTEVIETSGVEMDAYGDIGTHGVFDGEHTTDLGEEFSRHVATFKGLVPGEQYVLLVMVSLDAPDPLSPDNLLYAAQDMADENGNLSFDYVQRYETDYAYVVACGATNQNLKDAVITIPDAFSNEEPRVVSPVVTYNGKVLVEHLDYVLTGDYVYTAAGEYTFGIRGIYNYTGLVECTYTVEDFAIEVQPESYEGFVGDTAVFEVQVNNPDVTYQWYYSKDHGESWLKSSCTDSAYVVEFLSYRNNYLYRCEITDTDGVTLTTDVVSLTAKSVELAIVSHPVDYEGAVNDQVYFTVGATGNGLLYQWYFSNDGGETWAKSGTPGFASATLQPILREYRDGYQYYCQITDVFGSTVRSDVVSMTVKSSEVVITRQPEPVVDACLGQLYYFEAEATGDNLVYRWEYSSDGGVTWQQSWNQGYNTPTLGVRMNANRDGYFYRCKIVSGLKTVIYTDPASLNMQAPSAQILTQPVSVTVVVNKTIQFHVDAAGTDLTYSWYRSNDKGATWIQTYLSGYNTDTLSFVATEARAAMYMCKITDGSGHFIWTSPVKLHVQTAELAILTQPENVTCAAGTTASFCVEAQGDGLKYQWYASSDGGETWTASYLSGYNTANFSFTVNEARASRLYKCIITDSAGNTVETDWVSVILEISAE